MAQLVWRRYAPNSIDAIATISTQPTNAGDLTLNGTMTFAYGINDSGLITGEGWYNDGPGGLSDGNRTYILDASGLVSVPEPPSCMLLVIAACGLCPRGARAYSEYQNSSMRDTRQQSTAVTRADSLMCRIVVGLVEGAELSCHDHGCHYDQRRPRFGDT